MFSPIYLIPLVICLVAWGLAYRLYYKLYHSFTKFEREWGFHNELSEMKAVLYALFFVGFIPYLNIPMAIWVIVHISRNWQEFVNPEIN